MSGVGLTPGRVLRSEWIQLSTLRSTKVLLAAAALLLIGVGALVSLDTVHKFDAMTAADRADVRVEGQVLSGRILAELAIGVLGVMTIAGEYATGTIRATLAAVPRRLPVLWAKLAVLAGITFVTMTAASFASFFAGNAILSEHWDFSLSDPGVLRSLIGAGVALTFACLFGIVLGFILRNTAAAISSLFAILVVVPVIVYELYPDVSAHLPTGAMSSLVTARIANAMIDPLPGAMIDPLPAFALLCGYLALGFAGAAWTLVRRDA